MKIVITTLLLLYMASPASAQKHRNVDVKEGLSRAYELLLFQQIQKSTVPPVGPSHDALFNLWAAREIKEGLKRNEAEIERYPRLRLRDLSHYLPKLDDSSL